MARVEVIAYQYESLHANVLVGFVTDQQIAGNSAASWPSLPFTDPKSTIILGGDRIVAMRRRRKRRDQGPNVAAPPPPPLDVCLFCGMPLSVGDHMVVDRNGEMSGVCSRNAQIPDPPPPTKKRRRLWPW